MRMTTIHAQVERKAAGQVRLPREKRLCRARMLRVRGLIHRLRPFARRQTPLGAKTLAQRAKSGDLEVKRQASWGMSVDAFAALRSE
ncbi:hypothetical protein DEA98_29405 (plasmid) [Brucella pseudogrignonensis]|nr:hypothetical protein [Brucella pseudogrignonensis]